MYCHADEGSVTTILNNVKYEYYIVQYVISTIGEISLSRSFLREDDKF